MSKRLLIVSTYKTRCGMASFTEVLQSHLEGDFEVEIFPLDQFILRGRSARQLEAGDQLISELCEKVASYDVVSLQWDPGFFGAKRSVALSRFAKFAKAVPKLVLTAHTIVPPSADLNIGSFARSVADVGVRRSIDKARFEIRADGARLYPLFQKMDKENRLTVIAHTRRDRRFFEAVIGLSDVRDHPLSHLQADWLDTLESDAADYRARLREQFGKDSVLIGLFGFLVRHKGYETAIRALRELPENHKLLIFGGIHPNSISRNNPVDLYVDELKRGIEGKSADIAALALMEKQLKRKGTAAAGKSAFADLQRAIGPLSDRAIFMGSPDDYEFALAVKACDMAVFPYQEVGQSGSGPVSQSIELGTPTIVSNNKTFQELARYFPNRLHFFEIGNYLQLATQIRRVQNAKPPVGELDYDWASQKALYTEALNDRANSQ